MNPFGSLHQRLNHWLQSSHGPMFIRGVSIEAWCFIYASSLANLANRKNQVIIAPTIEEAEKVWDELKHLPQAIYYP